MSLVSEAQRRNVEDTSSHQLAAIMPGANWGYKAFPMATKFSSQNAFPPWKVFFASIQFAPVPFTFASDLSRRMLELTFNALILFGILWYWGENERNQCFSVILNGEMKTKFL
jgi:hypothetical protein